MKFTEITATAWVLFLIGISLLMGVLAGQIAVEMIRKYLTVINGLGMM